MPKLILPIEDENGFMTLTFPAAPWMERRLPHFVWRMPFMRGYRRHLRHVVLAMAILVGGTVFFSAVSFFLPSKVNFSFGANTCAFSPQLMPRLTTYGQSHSFQSSAHPTLSVLGYPVFSHKTCLTAKSAPTPGQNEKLKLSALGIPFLNKNIGINIGSLPAANSLLAPAELVPSSGLLSFKLDQADTVFAYRLNINEQTADCKLNKLHIDCPLENLSLVASSEYAYTLERMFDGQKVGDAVSGAFKTLDPVLVVSSTIAGDAVVYDSPREVIIKFNKAPASLDGIKLKALEPAGDSVGAEAALEADGVKIIFPEPLARNTLYELTLTQVTAGDGSRLERPFVLRFRTSGGPKVISSSIGAIKVQPSVSVVLTFDIGLQANQNWPDFASLEIGGRAVPASVSVSGNKLTINPDSDLPRCTPFTIKLSGGLVSQYGIGDGSPYEMRSKTICQQVFSIGGSVRGRSITGYRFGSGASKIVFVGGMHGNEKSSVYTLNAWVDYLENHAHELPANRSIIVIPNSSPDSFAASRRTNMNNVDLNRNYPSNDWQTGIYMPGNQYLPNGGGMTPLDQPESSALASFIQRENPRAVLTYHAVARIVITNDAGDSVSLGQKYASDAGYKFSSGANSGGTFEYATTGEFEDWLADREGIPAILVELGTMSSNEFGTHRRAMWNLALLP